jgi:hypothetical protein
MKTKLEDINIVPDFGKINLLTENGAKCALYGMAALSASMAFELYIKEKYYKKPDGLESDYTDLLLKRFEDAAKEIGRVCVAKEGEIK